MPISARRAAAALFVLLFLPSCARAADITVYRDQYGVPGIKAASLEDAVYALGYCMAVDGAEYMARNYKLARGRIAEVDGPGQLIYDTFLRSLGVEEYCEKEAQILSPEQGRLLHAFVDGANRGLAEQKGKLPDWIEPFTVVDVLALAQLINAAFPLLDVANQILPGFASGPHLSPGSPRATGPSAGRTSHPVLGSNQFAIAPRRSATGHALLSIDPHLIWSAPMLWYEFGYYTPQFSFHGITLPGLPFGVMGHTDKVGWCMTNNSPVLYTLYTVKTNPANPHQYSYHGEWRDFEDVPLTLRYRQDGQLKSRTQTVRRTAWGPMVPLHPWAVKLSMLGDWTVLDEALAMARAKDARQFREALRPLGLSMWNIVYADTRGHIGYQYNARVPRRDATFDWSKPVPGDDPRTRWGDLWTLDELPHAQDPKSGLLINANSAPWLTTLGDEISSTGWPAYVTSYGHTTRYDRLVTLLSPTVHVTPDHAEQIATDTEVPYARAAVARLIAETEPGGLANARATLRSWDCRSNLDCRGCGLYLYWLTADPHMRELARKAGVGETWTTEEAASATAALQKAVDTMQAQHGRLDLPWDSMHYARRGSAKTGLIGFASGNHAAVVPNSGPFRNGNVECNVGSSFRMIIDLDPRGVRSWSILPYGESQDPSNPHYADQLPLFAKGQYKDTLFTLRRLQRESASHQTLQK